MRRQEKEGRHGRASMGGRCGAAGVGELGERSPYYTCNIYMLVEVVTKWRVLLSLTFFFPFPKFV